MSTKKISFSFAGYTQPYNGWTNWSTYTEIYTGYSTVDDNTYACKLSFTIDGDLAASINSINTLNISLQTSQNSNPGYTIAFLMNRELSPSECKTDTINSSTSGYIASGYIGLAENIDVASGTTVTYSFTGVNLTAGTYHIYILRKGWSYYGFCAFKSTADALPQMEINYIAKYIVSYNLNGGSSNLPSNQTKIEGQSLKLSSTKPIKNDTFDSSSFNINGNANGGKPNSSITATENRTYEWIFSHWTDANGNRYDSGGTYNGNSDITLYANYSLSNTLYEYVNNKLSGLTTPSRDTDINAVYIVTFDPNGGLCNTDSLNTNNTTSYAFTNWNSKATEDGTNYNSNSEFTKETTVYAKWNRTTKTDPITLPTALRDGYDFMGWSTNASAESGIMDPTYIPSSNVTLYAIWKAKGLVRIRINGELREALVYIHHDGDFNQSMPMVYNTDEFKISG